VNPPEPEPQLPVDTAPPEALPADENNESFFRVSLPAQRGQGGRSPAWSKRILFSNSCPQSAQMYSY